MLTLAQSRQHIETKYGWQIDESTFQLINEKSLFWAARVTTTQFLPDQQIAFYCLVQGQSFWTIEEQDFQAFVQWVKRIDAL